MPVVGGHGQVLCGLSFICLPALSCCSGLGIIPGILAVEEASGLRVCPGDCLASLSPRITCSSTPGAPNVIHSSKLTY